MRKADRGWDGAARDTWASNRGVREDMGSVSGPCWETPGWVPVIQEVATLKREKKIFF